MGGRDRYTDQDESDLRIQDPPLPLLAWPGARQVLDPLELIEDGSGGRTANRDLCFPPSRLEEQSNPNLP